MLPTWYIITQLIITEGLPLAEAIFNKWSSGNPPSKADFDEFRTLAKSASKDRMLLALAKAGVDPESDQGKIFLSMV